MADPAPVEDELGPEDAKLLVLARAARARARSQVGAACRDLDGRTYAAGSVELPSLRLSALQVCVAMAVTSGARGLEAVLVLGGPPSDRPATGPTGLAPTDAAVLADLAGDRVVVHLR